MPPNPIRVSRGALVAVAVLVAGSGCTEVRGRKRIREGNELYRAGKYEEAVAAFVEAEELVPHLPTLWLNKGYTCRQLMIPGSKAPESVKAAECALASFLKLQELAPRDKRAVDLYIQTLFDADRFETLAKMFEDKQKQKPCDVDIVGTLEQIYAKWGKFDAALEWYEKAAECQAGDAEKQYAVGVFIYQELFRRGGGQGKQMFDPRPQPGKPPPVPPGDAPGDILRQQRVDMAELGIKYLDKAVALRPTYTEAMAYINLLWRQRSFAFFDQPDEWQKSVDKATEMMKKTLEIMKASQGGAAKGDGGVADGGDPAAHPPQPGHP